jgi:3-isopropylmalate dehydrogenase
VGDARYDHVDRALRPEQAIPGLRKQLGLYASLRQVKIEPELASLSPLTPERVRGLDLLIVRELSGDVYMGTPRGQRVIADGPGGGEREGFDTMRYCESEVRRVAQIAFDAARARSKCLCSVDKANVLETSRLWRQVVTELGKDYPDIAVTHQYADNAGVQMIVQPMAFDTIVTGNLFGDLLSDAASALTGVNEAEPVRSRAWQCTEYRRAGSGQSDRMHPRGSIDVAPRRWAPRRWAPRSCESY